jgi:predicted RNase H-like HicB family nuclease
VKDLEYYLNLNYEIRLRKLSEEEGGGWFAEIPKLPGCMSDGATPEEALANLQDAKKCWIENCLELGRLVPEPVPENYSGQIRIRIPRSLHRIMAEKAREENVSLNQYISYQLARSVGFSQGEEQVKSK